MQFIDLTSLALVATLIAASSAGAQTPPTPTTAVPAVTASAATTLSVTFTGIEAKRGAIMVALYDEAAWNSGRPVRAETLDASTGSASIVISGLPAGRYGVKAFHDVNGNGKMDSNPFGMPTEPFAFSNDAKGQRGPANWADASFTITNGANSQTITIR